MPRRVPCFAFRNGIGKLDRLRPGFAVQRGDRMRRTALRDDIARATFTLTTLGGHAEFELHFIEGHASARMACDFTIRDSAANANDHGGEAADWLAV